MTYFLAAVITAAVLIGLWWWVEHPKREEDNDTNSTDFELWRIDQAKQMAMNDIRRRRLYAEEQLRRLGRWQR